MEIILKEDKNKYRDDNNCTEITAWDHSEIFIYTTALLFFNGNYFYVYYILLF